ncbi:MAG: hypothetical protein IKB79_06990 [Oscillospiraceae bacterium]|nr:hypothetical protein [Oscillospiraceae bacterium]
MKKLLCTLLSIVVLVSCMTAHVLAANETEASTSVQYTVESGYTVSIPATLSLNNTGYMDIYASNVSLDQNKKLYVKIDKSKTSFTYDQFYLMNGSNYIPCDLKVGSPLNDEKIPYYDTDYVVAIFETGYTEPTQYGRLYITPSNGAYEAGTYSGTIYFEIYSGYSA